MGEILQEEKLIYDPDKSTIMAGFGLTEERMNKLLAEYVHGSRADVIYRIVESKTLPPNERYALLIALGTKLVENVILEMQEQSGFIPQALTDKGA